VISKRYYPAALAAGVAVLGGLLLWPRKTAARPLPGSPPSPGLPTGPLPAGTTALTSYLSDDFFRGVIKLTDYANSKGATLRPEDFLAVFLAESNVNWDPKNKRPGSVNFIGCAGLNQICDLFGVGFPQERGFVGDAKAWAKADKRPYIEQYAALPTEEQLAYVKRYFDNWNKYPKLVNYGALYLCNFMPGFLDHASEPNFVMCRRAPEDDGTLAFAKAQKGSAAYYPLNRGVDREGKGYIEVADMTRFVERAVAASRVKFNEMRMRLANVRASV
jgi:hypothetical protein